MREVRRPACIPNESAWILTTAIRDDVSSKDDLRNRNGGTPLAGRIGLMLVLHRMQENQCSSSRAQASGRPLLRWSCLDGAAAIQSGRVPYGTTVHAGVAPFQRFRRSIRQKDAILAVAVEKPPRVPAGNLLSFIHGEAVLKAHHD
jgi:hypothetical protein